MASITAAQSSGQITLSGTTVDTVTITQLGPLTICNWSGAADLTVTIAVNGSAASTPVAGAADTWRIPPGMARVFEFPSYNSPGQVKVLGNGNVYSVDRG